MLGNKYRLGIKFSKESLQKLRERPRHSPNLGRKWSDEYKQKMILAQLKRWKKIKGV